MKHLAACAFVFAAACGDDLGPPVDPQPDAAEPVTFTPHCEEVPQAGGAAQFASPAELGEITPGTLAGWDPDGRWFLTGTRVGSVSSFHFQRAGSQIIVDKDAGHPGTIDDDVVFQRVVQESTDGAFIIAKRVSDLRADGSLRADRAVCDGANCRVCTARLVRAAYNDGEAESEKLSLIGELYGADWAPTYTLNVRVVGDLAYVVRFDGLKIIDISDLAHPVQVGAYARGGDSYSNDVKIVSTAQGRRYALIADAPVDVVDVTDPTNPQLVANILEEAHTLFTETRDGTTTAYFGNYDASSAAWDVTDPATPKRLGKIQTDGALVHDLSVADGIAYLDAWDAGLVVADFTNPAQPKVIGQWADTPTGTSHSNWTTTVAGRHIAVHGEESYGAHLEVVDLDAGPTFMRPIGTYKTRDHVSIHNIMAFGNKAYVTYYQDGVRVLDLSDPTNPRLAGYFNTWDPQADYATSAFFDGAVGLDVDLQRKLIFVADGRGLLILRDDT